MISQTTYPLQNMKGNSSKRKSLLLVGIVVVTVALAFIWKKEIDKLFRQPEKDEIPPILPPDMESNLFICKKPQSTYSDYVR